MKGAIILFLCLIAGVAFAQAPANDNCDKAIVLTNLKNYCSNNGQFTSVGATPSFQNSGNDVWFKFTAINFEVSITVTGASAGGTLLSPDIDLYTDCQGTGLIGSVIRDNNLTTFTKGGLTIGSVYYFKVSGANNGTGTFQLCINNYNPPVKAGQDFETASTLCSTEGFTEHNVTGAGNNASESAGTCMGGSEANSVWYKWIADNDGTLVFTITPTKFDDIDWVLYDLGLEGNAGKPSAGNAIRCAAGHGINNTSCPSEPLYSKTGLDFDETDVSEGSGCGSGQNGKVKFLTMQKGHVYALLVNNFSQGSNGFTLAFTDQAGKSGTGQIAGPSASLQLVQSGVCTPQQSQLFTGAASNYTSLLWNFGEGASIPPATTPGPFTVTYSTPGIKTVVFQAINDKGCSVVATQTFAIGSKPASPVILANKPDFCIKDTIKLSVAEVEGAVFHWTGPNNFTSEEREISIPIEDFSVAGEYTVYVDVFGCISESTTITVPPVLKNPTAAFRTDPGTVAKYSAPLRVTFINESVDADSFLWDFGDGTTSTERDPVHEYTTSGDFNVTLTAFKSDVCQATVVKGTFIIRAGNGLFIPNTFTPNGDNTNDEFVVTLTNLRSYYIRIYNRWGEHLFETADIFENWKGLYKGEPVPVGTYYYVIDATGIDGTGFKRSGAVTVIR